MKQNKSPTREWNVVCHACGHHTRTITIGNAAWWRKAVNMSVVRVCGGASSSRDTDEIRTLLIAGAPFEFRRDDLREEWPEAEKLVEREDAFDL